MSFKNFSSALGATAKADPDDKSKNAPSVDQPSVQAGKTPADVEAALSRTGAVSMEDFMALVSPAASSSLERMATALTSPSPNVTQRTSSEKLQFSGFGKMITFSSSCGS